MTPKVVPKTKTVKIQTNSSRLCQRQKSSSFTQLESFRAESVANEILTELLVWNDFNIVQNMG